MALKIQTTFIATSTVQTRAYVYDDDDTLTDPTSVSITIIDSAGTTKVDAQAMTKTATGTYDYWYNTAADSETGQWNGKVVVVDGSGDSAKTSIGTFGFKVI